MTTANDIITDALQWIGAYDSASPLASGDAQLGLRMLTNMMDMWSNYSLACYEIQEQSAPLVPGQSAYTIGTGGNFNMTRPLSVVYGPGAAYVQDQNGNNYPVDVMQRDRWNLFGNRSNIITSNFPNAMFYDPQFPLGIINIIPYPTTAYTLFWDSTLPLQTFANLATVLSLPPGYEIAMKSNLAIILKPFFLDSQIPPELAVMAAASLGAIKRTNARDNTAIYDAEIVSRGKVSYNPYTDSVGSVVPSS